MNEGIYKMWDIHTMEYYSAIIEWSTDYSLQLGWTWETVRKPFLRVYDSIHVSPNRESTETVISSCMGLAGREQGGWGVIANGYGFSFWDENVLKRDGCTYLHVLKATEPYTLNGCVVWCVNYISKLVFKKIEALYPRETLNGPYTWKGLQAPVRKTKTMLRTPSGPPPQVHSLSGVTVPTAGEGVRHLCWWE